MSKEHLLSRPICDVLGMDRATTTLGRFDAAQNTVTSAAALEQASVRTVCTTCNNGWMNDLEHAAADVLSRWPNGQPLSDADSLALRRWLTKTHLVLCMIEGGARNFFNDPVNSVLINATAAKALANDDHARLDALAFAAARVVDRTVLYAFGTPTIKSPGQTKFNNTVATASVLFLGNVQMWTIDCALPMYEPGGITPPAFTTTIASGVGVNDLAVGPSYADVTDAVVDLTPLTPEFVAGLFKAATIAGSERGEGT